MTNVEIEYCVPCGHRNNALETADAILETYGRDLDGVQLTPGGGGIFEVTVGDEIVFGNDDSGYDLDAIVEDVGARLEE